MGRLHTGVFIDSANFDTGKVSGDREANVERNSIASGAEGFALPGVVYTINPLFQPGNLVQSDVILQAP